MDEPVAVLKIEKGVGTMATVRRYESNESRYGRSEARVRIQTYTIRG